MEWNWKASGDVMKDKELLLQLLHLHEGEGQGGASSCMPDEGKQVSVRSCEEEHEERRSL